MSAKDSDGDRSFSGSQSSTYGSHRSNWSNRSHHRTSRFQSPSKYNSIPPTPPTSSMIAGQFQPSLSQAVAAVRQTYSRIVDWSSAGRKVVSSCPSAPFFFQRVFPIWIPLQEFGRRILTSQPNSITHRHYYFWGFALGRFASAYPNFRGFTPQSP